VETACTTIPRTAVSTPLIRDADRAGAAPGPASSIPETDAPASAPDADGPAWASHVMNEANCSTPAGQDRLVCAHQRRNSAIACAYAFVVDSAPSRPNR
jgi:hypothetical protein